MTMIRKAIEPDHFPFFDYKRYAFCLGIGTPEGFWLSGHTAARYEPSRDAMVIEGDFVSQSRAIHDKIGLILQAAGLGFGNVVRVVDYLSPAAVEAYGAMADLRRELYGDALPATSAVVVKSLLRPEALVEVEVVASAASPIPVEVEPLRNGSWGCVATRVGDLLYVSAQLPVQPESGEIVGPGDIVVQARQIYENTSAILATAGFGWENVVKTVDRIAVDGLPRYRETGAIRREFLGPAYPAATGIVMPRLAHPDALLQVEFIAAAGCKEVINPGWSRYDNLTYAPAVKVGRLLFLSGQGALDEESLTISSPRDVRGQIQYIYGKLREVLVAAGADLNALVQTVEFITPDAQEQYKATAAVRRALFHEPYPAATGVICERLLRDDMLVEVDALAVLD